MHHHFRSRFLIDTLFATGYCSSYCAALRFEENAASSVASDVLGCSDLSHMMVLFATDNVDRNIVSLDGKHGYDSSYYPTTSNHADNWKNSASNLLQSRIDDR